MENIECPPPSQQEILPGQPPEENKKVYGKYILHL
jgi:hypothetical protein